MKIPKNNEVIEHLLGTSITAPLIDIEGIPIENIHHECRCANCASDPKKKNKTDTTTIDKLEKLIQDLGLKRL